MCKSDQIVFLRDHSLYQTALLEVGWGRIMAWASGGLSWHRWDSDRGLLGHWCHLISPLGYPTSISNL